MSRAFLSPQMSDNHPSMAGEIASLLISRMAVPVLYFMAYSRKPKG